MPVIACNASAWLEFNNQVRENGRSAAIPEACRWGDISRRVWQYLIARSNRTQPNTMHITTADTDIHLTYITKHF